MTAVSAIDWIGLFIVLASLVLGAWRGLVYEVVLLAGWVLALVVAIWCSAWVGSRLPMGQSSEPQRHVVGFLLVFIVIAFIGGFFAHRARRATLVLGVRPVDRVFGAAFGFVRGLVLLLALTVVALKTPLHEESWWRSSVSAHWLERGLRQMQPWLPPSLRKYLATSDITYFQAPAAR